jgi:hypothetical protein
MENSSKERVQTVKQFVWNSTQIFEIKVGILKSSQVVIAASDTLVNRVKGEFFYAEGSHVAAEVYLVHVIDARHFKVSLLINLFCRMYSPAVEILIKNFRELSIFTSH